MTLLLGDQQWWLAPAEIVGFIGLILTAISLIKAIRNERVRLTNETSARIAKIEMHNEKQDIAFNQYEKDAKEFRTNMDLNMDRFQKNYLENTEAFRAMLRETMGTFLDSINKTFTEYLRSCEVCKKEVRNHHEDASLHVTSDLRMQISTLSSDVKTVVNYLIGNQMGSK